MFTYVMRADCAPDWFDAAPFSVDHCTFFLRLLTYRSEVEV
uniref:Uncharacterized protein n=1 Tax=Arundo donax TaxID=35708 RepID=A0A0A8ZP82_ARUDO